MNRGTRAELISHLVAGIDSRKASHPIRVAVDGPPAGGKTTLADEVGEGLRERGRQVIRACVDDFMVPVERRYWRGRYSAEGCYFDAHDWVGVCRFLLDPMGPGGDRRVRRTVGGGEFTAPPDAVLLFDGVFLLRPELVARWEMSIFVSVPLELTVGRALERGAGVGEIERSWRERYIPAQEFYYAKDRPADHADVVVFNEEFGRPGWVSR